MEKVNDLRTKILTKRFLLLWGIICAGRLLYTLAPLANHVLRPYADFAYFAFLLTVVVFEIAILRKTAADYPNSLPLPHPLEANRKPKAAAVYPFHTKLTIGLFMFGLIFVLWDTRNDNHMVLLMVLGVALNLGWVWMFAAPRLRQNAP